MNANRWTKTLVALSCTAALSGQEPDPIAIFQKVAGVYSTLASFQVTAARTDEVHAGGGGGMAESEYVFAGQKPGKMHLRIRTQQMETLLVTDGERTWRALPREKRWAEESVAQIGDDEERDEATANGDPQTEVETLLVRRYAGFAKLGPLAKIVKTATLRVDGEKAECWVIELGRRGNLHRVWVDKARYLVLQHEEAGKLQGGQNGEYKTVIKVRKIALGKGVDDSLFTFDAPERWKKEEYLAFPNEPNRSLEGRPAPNFTLKTLAGDEVSLAGLRGKTVLINFWATWCPPCRAELPHIDRMSREFEGSEKVILTINNEDTGVARGYVKDKKYAMPVLMDGKNQVSRLYGVRAIPTVLVVDKRGIVRAHLVGGRSEETLRKAMDAAGQ